MYSTCGMGKNTNSLQKSVGLLNYINNLCILKFLIISQSQIITRIFNEIKIRAHYNYSVMSQYLIFHNVHQVVVTEFLSCEMLQLLLGW